MEKTETIQEQCMKVILHNYNELLSGLVKDGLKQKGFGFQSQDEFHAFIKSNCKLFYDKEFNMCFQVNTNGEYISFLFVENPNNFFKCNPYNFENQNKVELNYKFL